MASEAMLFESCQKTSTPAWRARNESTNFCQQLNHRQLVGALARNTARRGSPPISGPSSESRFG
eukprot:1490193-Pyramimonas_sp.AAC.1